MNARVEDSPESIAPLNKDGGPDLMNYMPTRFVPIDEAKQRGWPHFYEGQPCRYGHRAPRYVSNPRMCVDCFRVSRGKNVLTASPVSSNVEYKKPRDYAQRKLAVAGAAAPTAVAVSPLEPDRVEKKFLVRYAEVKDIDVAASLIGVSAAQIIARMSWSRVFADAVAKIEDELGLTRVPVPTGPFEWNDDKQKRLIEVYVDTGDIATARDSIRVTPSEYFRELERNPDFSAMLKEAEPLAHKALEERATQMSLAGNDKLLLKVLAAKMPEYRERVNVDMNVTEKMTDDQLDAQLTRLVSRYASNVFDGEFTVLDDASGQAKALAHAAGAGSEEQAEPNSDLL
jgi:hypothetical protein